MGTFLSSIASNSAAFNGSSSYASDLQQVITRAVQIASLPIQQLENNLTTFGSEQTALSSLSMSFSSLQTAITGIGTAVNSGGYSLSYSNSAVATATASRGTLLGTYNLQVSDTGTQASAMSTASVSDPTTETISSSPVFTLTANGQTYTNIVPPPDSNTLTSLVTAISTATQGAVQATIVNLGTPSQPSYQLSIQNTAYGSLPITLTDEDGNNLLGAPTDAAPVEYTLNGQGPLTSNSRTLAIGLNLTATVQTAGSTSITVGQNTSAIANALQSFVSAYNSAAQALTGQRGQSGGALTGQSIIDTLSRSLQSMANYRGSGAVQSLADIGLTFNDTSGQLSFDATKLSSAASSSYADLMSFLGGAKTGGFLETATDTLKGVLDSSSGAIPTEMKSLTGAVTTTNDKINQQQDRVNQLQTHLTAQMTAADALIARMQAQVSYLTTMFTAQTAYQNQIANG